MRMSSSNTLLKLQAVILGGVFCLVWVNTEEKVDFYCVRIKEIKICVQEECE